MGKSDIKLQHIPQRYTVTIAIAYFIIWDGLEHKAAKSALTNTYCKDRGYAYFICDQMNKDYEEYIKIRNSIYQRRNRS